MWRGVALFAANDAETYEVRAMMYGSRRGAVGMTYMRHQRARMGLVCPWQMASMLSHSYTFNLYSSAVRLLYCSIASTGRSYLVFPGPQEALQGKMSLSPIYNLPSNPSQ